MIYPKRRKAEEFPKSLKANEGLAKSPTHMVTPQNNLIFIPIYTAFKLEWLKIKHKSIILQKLRAS